MVDVITPAWERSKANLRPNKAGKGARVLSTLLSGASTWGWPGNWSQDRLEQAFHFKHWLYVAVNRRGNSFAENHPNLAFVNAPRTASTQKRFANRYHVKAMGQVKPHEEVEPVPADHPLARLIDRPNETDTWGQLIYELAMYLDLTGNGFLWLVPNAAGVPCELWVLPSHWVWMRAGKGRWIDYFEVRPFVGTGTLKFPPEEVLWIKKKSPIHKYDGWAPTTAIAEWIDAAESVDRSRFWQFKNGCFPFGHLKLGESYLDPDQPDLERAYAKLFGRLQGEVNYGRPLVTGADVEYTPLMISPMEMAYVQSADQLRDWVLAAYGVPKEIAGIQDAGSEIAMYGPMLQYCRFSLAPDLKLMAEAFTQHLCHRFDERIRLWWDDPTPENPEQKRADHQALFAMGAITPNENRAAFGLEPYREGGDDPLLPMGTGPLPLNTGESLGDVGMTPAEEARYGSLDEPETGTTPDPLAAASKAMRWQKDSYFEHCPRDEEGHCQPSGSGQASGGSREPASDPAAHRPTRPGERHKNKTPPKLKFRAPPPPQGRSKAPGQGYAANGMTNTAFGDMAEDIVSALELRSILPPGKRQNPLDREYDHSGWAFEVKSVTVESKEYKAKPKKSEVASKIAYAKKHKLRAGTMINVVDTEKGEAHVYWREGIGAFALTETNASEWNYAGTVRFQVPGKRG